MGSVKSIPKYIGCLSITLTLALKLERNFLSVLRCLLHAELPLFNKELPVTA